MFDELSSSLGRWRDECVARLSVHWLREVFCFVVHLCWMLRIVVALRRGNNSPESLYAVNHLPYTALALVPVGHLGVSCGYTYAQMLAL